LDQQKLEHYKQLLDNAEKEVITRLAQLEEGSTTGLRDSLQELSMYDNHPADLGTEVFERSKDIGLRDLARVQLFKIREALARIEEGNYGICEHCGKEIPESRLEAVPETTLCLHCQQKVEEKDQLLKKRPVEEQIIRPPFGWVPEEIYLEDMHRERIVYDGQDSWQDVAHYGTSSDIAYGKEAEQRQGIVEDVESVPYWKGKNGVFYKDFRGWDDEDQPEGPV
jgi:YteA family regulatory protein